MNMQARRRQGRENRPVIHRKLLKGPRIISPNLREEERPGELKVRYKVRIETGRKARELDARQAEVIRELLIWARHYRTSPPRRP
jgi:hypothetical protein